MLGNMYATGEVSKGGSRKEDIKESLHWYRASADEGYGPSALQVGKLLASEEEERVAMMLKNNNVESSPSNHYQYHSKKNLEVLQQAKKYLKIAAEKGLAEAWTILGFFHYRGTVTNVTNPKEAFQCFKMAAKLGDSKGWAMAATCYENGEGTDQDYDAAIEWHEKAARAGWAISMNALGSIYFHGRNGDQDHEEALNWYERAANHGDADAQVQVALMKMYGQGCESNLIEAREWLMKARNQGSDSAVKILRSVFKTE